MPRLMTEGLMDESDGVQMGEDTRGVQALAQEHRADHRGDLRRAPLVPRLRLRALSRRRGAQATRVRRDVQDTANRGFDAGR